MPIEYWDIYSEKDDSFVRKMRRGDGKLEPGEYHLAVEIIPTDREGHILVTRRSLEKSRGGGLYEFPAGSVISGETTEAAGLRELREETGLSAHSILEISRYSTFGIHRVIYLAYIPDLLTAKIRLQEGETMAYRIVTLADFQKMIAQGIFDPFRARMYGPEVYKNLNAEVGFLPATEEPSAPRRLLLRPELSGTRAGTSGKAVYTPIEEE